MEEGGLQSVLCQSHIRKTFASCRISTFYGLNFAWRIRARDEDVVILLFSNLQLCLTLISLLVGYSLTKTSTFNYLYSMGWLYLFVFTKWLLCLSYRRYD